VPILTKAVLLCRHPDRTTTVGSWMPAPPRSSRVRPASG